MLILGHAVSRCGLPCASPRCLKASGRQGAVSCFSQVFHIFLGLFHAASYSYAGGEKKILMWPPRDFQAFQIHFNGLPPAADGVSRQQGLRLDPVRKASPKGQLCLIKGEYSLPLPEAGWVCRVSEQGRSSFAINFSQLHGLCLLMYRTRACDCG